ncbi:plant cysteine oxidase 2-like [Musa acuminata AAA Group]|uniref:plant cysteine oxidase 2-like n=1 Tax=Musa acuminata AAA Group TaxID=214697 RepID=UPI0031E3D616
MGPEIYVILQRQFECRPQETALPPLLCPWFPVHTKLYFLPSANTILPLGHHPPSPPCPFPSPLPFPPLWEAAPLQRIDCGQSLIFLSAFAAARAERFASSFVLTALAGLVEGFVDWSSFSASRTSVTRLEGKLAEQKKPEASAPAGKFASGKRLQAANKSRRKQKKPGQMPSVVQRLFETCKEVFAEGGDGIIPSLEDVNRLRSVLDNVGPSDVGLTQNMPYFQNSSSAGTLSVTYLHIYECHKFSIGIFCLPPSGVIPLHNHPGMTVFSKLLFGSMHIKSYDWVNVPQNSDEIVNSLHYQHPGLRLAKVKTDAIFTAPCKASVLYPEDGGDGKLAADEDEVYAWLEERKKPDDFLVVGARYSGPRIMER